MPSQESIDVVKSETSATKEELHEQHRQFIDYWDDKTGQAATRVKWDGTWRNWMRRAAKKGDIGKVLPRNGSTNGKPHKLRALADLAAEVREMENNHGKALDA